jgi:hypothetical protein
MKKYVLNIDKLYSGQTASALVLSQIDEDFPTLLPSVPEGETDLLGWIRKCKSVNPKFQPPSLRLTRERLNESIVEFNLKLQEQFKAKGHQELYMMDDTQTMKPNVSTYSTDKTYLHNLNGKSIEDGQNSSQFNVLFPYKKTTSKSLYSSQLKVIQTKQVDGKLESSRNITLTGNVSYLDCVQDVQKVGQNIYVMSPNVSIGQQQQPTDRIHVNGTTLVNGYDMPYMFPQSMTLFQPSQDQFDRKNLEGGKTPFIEWCKKHDCKTVVSLKDQHGGNTSDLRILGYGSYEIDLATYGPSDIVVGSRDNPTWWNLTTATYGRIRSGEDEVNKYDGGKYVFANLADEKNVPSAAFMFNLHDTFITDQDRILKMTVPQDKEFNELMLTFDCQVLHSVPGGMEVHVEVNGSEVFLYDGGDFPSKDGVVQFKLADTAVQAHEVLIAVRIHYDVDFNKRDVEKEYKERLLTSGVMLRDIRIDNGVHDGAKRLTFGQYVNEDGIDAETRESRLQEFWKVSQYTRDMTYQMVLESPLCNIVTSGMKYPNNYSTGDLYGDVFVTKSLLDPRYNMEMSLDSDNEALLLVGREYIGMGSCSNQLSLMYKPTRIRIPTDETQVTERVDGDLLKYQMVEVVKSINRFESSIKHKSNVFSVVVENSNLAKDESADSDDPLEKYKEQLRNSVTQFVRDVCEGIVPVHTQLFDVQFT